jgi:predicted permease
LPKDRLRAFRKELLARVRAIPGVEAAASASTIPIAGRRYENVFLEGPEGRRKELAYSNKVSAGYFETLGTALVAGRDFDDRDTPTSPGVVVVNQAFVHKILPGTEPVGTTFRLEGVSGEPGPSVQVVGIVENTKYGDLREEFKPIVYVADSQQERQPTFDPILIRSPMTPAALIPHVSRAIEAAHTDISFHFHDFQEQVRHSILQDRLMATLCGFFAILAAVLAVVGVYGVMSYSVAQRTVEIGIRLALGAARRSITALILREALLLLAAGLLLGLALTAAAGRVAGTMLFALQPGDPATLAAACVLLTAAACAAGYLPARRASRTDPLLTLRRE